jgi:hypothetical protein
MDRSSFAQQVLDLATDALTMNAKHGHAERLVQCIVALETIEHLATEQLSIALQEASVLPPSRHMSG